LQDAFFRVGTRAALDERGCRLLDQSGVFTRDYVAWLAGQCIRTSLCPEFPAIREINSDILSIPAVIREHNRIPPEFSVPQKIKAS